MSGKIVAIRLGINIKSKHSDKVLISLELLQIANQFFGIRSQGKRRFKIK